MFLHIVDASHCGDHQLQLQFSDGATGVIDLSKVLDGPIYQPLRDVEYFKEFIIEGNTIAWKNGADFAPEYLHELLHAQTPVAS